jgi:hypothetical protein
MKQKSTTNWFWKRKRLVTPLDISILGRFSARSAGDHRRKDLWLRGASEHIPQLNRLQLRLSGFRLSALSIESFENPESSSLSSILIKHGSDKSRPHNWHLFYSWLFQQLGSLSKLAILEIGMGSNDPEVISNMGKAGKPGASLRAWAEYCPNSLIFGADVDLKTLFQESRIETMQVDQTELLSLRELPKKFSVDKYDLIIDDGIHSIHGNLNSLLFGLDHVTEGGWIVIEDVYRLDNWEIPLYLMSQSKEIKAYVIEECRKVQSGMKRRYLIAINREPFLNLPESDRFVPLGNSS